MKSNNTEMSVVERELRDLMNEYHILSVKLEEERKEAKADGEDLGTVECLQRQCRIMTAKLFKTMKRLNILDEEEVEFGGIKDK